MTNVDSASDRVIEGTGGGYDTVYTTADYTLAAGSSVEALVSVSAARLLGNELNNMLVGSNRDNALFGGGGSAVPSVSTDRLRTGSLKALLASRAGHLGGLPLVTARFLILIS